MGFLNNLSLDQIDDSSVDYSINNGVYPAMISDSKIMSSPKSGDNLWQITYKLDSDVQTFGGRTVSEFFNLDPNLPDDRKTWIKRRLTSLGINAEEASNMDPGDIIGVEVTITVRNKQVQDKTYTNITKVVLGAESPSMAANF